MPQNRAAKSPTWRMQCPEEVSRPKGPQDALRDAVDALGPFAHTRSADAEAAGDLLELGTGAVARSEEAAREIIVDIATRFNKQEFLAKDAPRVKHVVDRLKGLAHQTAALANYLQSLDDITRHELQQAGISDDLSRRMAAASMKSASVEELPRVSTDRDAPEQSGWVTALRSLSRYAETTMSNFLERVSRRSHMV